jgi:hypothetical protein
MHLHFYNILINNAVDQIFCVAWYNFQFYVLTVYINSVHTIFAVPDDESINSKHVETCWVQTSKVLALNKKNSCAYWRAEINKSQNNEAAVA